MALIALGCWAPAVQAALPGVNGRLVMMDSACVWTLNPDGSDRRLLTSSSDLGLEGTNDWEWSPDGERLALEGSQESNRDIYVFDVDSGDLDRVTSAPARDGGPVWSPDGDQLAYVSEASGQPDIYIVSAAGGTPSRVTDTAVREGFLSWAPDGSQLAFSTRPNGTNETLRAIGVDGQGERTLFTGNPYAQQADWSPDGEKIAFVSGQEGEFAKVWVVDADGTDAHLLRKEAGGPSWSPDGTRIAFIGPLGGGRKYLGTMAADGSDVTVLAEDAWEGAWGTRQAPPAHSANGGDVNCDGAVRVAVLGDSYISGEGAADGGEPYRPGTDEDNPLEPWNVNRCHRSERSWGVQLARRLTRPAAKVIDFPAEEETAFGDAILFLACSGAVTDNVDGVRTRASAGQPTAVQYTEGATQLERLAGLEPETIDVVLLSIGGNDAGFGDIVEDCLLTRCLALNGWTERYLGRLDELRDRTAELIVNVREVAPGAELYRIDYPDPLRPLPQDCGSLGATGLAGLIGKFADGGMKIDAAERRWFSETFQAQLNGMLDAGSLLAGAHVIDVADAFRDHAICSPQPYAHGLKAGRSGLSPVGAESFHPTVDGQDRLLQATLAQYPLKGFGLRPNPDPIDLVPEHDVDYLSVAVVGDNPETDVFTSSSQPHVILKDGPPNTVIVVPTFSLGSVGGRGVTDAEGNAEIPVRLGPSVAPGLHHLELWTEDGRRLDAAPFVVEAGQECVGAPDLDGDQLTDLCDLDSSDGPLADPDGDGLPNGGDGCPLQAGAGSADVDADGEPDECDPDQGADLFATGLRGSLLPPDAVPPGPPRDLVAVSSGGAVTASWSPPAEDGGSSISGYVVSVPGRPDLGGELGPAASKADFTGLVAGTSLRIIVRARNAAGVGAVALSAPVVVSPSLAPPINQGTGGAAAAVPLAPAAAPTDAPPPKKTKCKRPKRKQRGSAKGRARNRQGQRKASGCSKRKQRQRGSAR